MKQFANPKTSLGDLDAETAATVIAMAADVALIVDGEGVVRDLAFERDDLLAEVCARWLGKPWLEIVTSESRPKVEALLREASSQAAFRWRQVNHPSPGGNDVPVMYAAVPIGGDGRIVAVGRDLREVAELQQRLVHAQQSVERDYDRLRQAEVRYRLLFQATAEAVLIVDGASRRVLEANAASHGLLADADTRIVGRSFPWGLDGAGTAAVEALVATVRSGEAGETIRVRSAAEGREWRISATLFRQDQGERLLVRIVPATGARSAVAKAEPSTKLCRFVDRSPDAFVVTDLAGRIAAANRAFLEMTQLAVEKQAASQSLDRWLGRPGVDLKVLVSNLREYGSIRLFPTSLRGEHGTAVDVELSAAAVAEAEDPFCAFAIRNVSQRLDRPPRGSQEWPRSVEQLTELVGGAPLREIVRESTDIIERLCIEAALELTGDNRAAAAELLGLSRQSLYVKLRRYGLSDADA